MNKPLSIAIFVYQRVYHGIENPMKSRQNPMTSLWNPMKSLQVSHEITTGIPWTIYIYNIYIWFARGYLWFGEPLPYWLQPEPHLRPAGLCGLRLRFTEVKEMLSLRILGTRCWKEENHEKIQKKMIFDIDIGVQKSFLQLLKRKFWSTSYSKMLIFPVFDI